MAFYSSEDGIFSFRSFYFFRFPCHLSEHVREAAIQSEQPLFLDLELASLMHSSTTMEIPSAVVVSVQHPVESNIRHFYVLARPIKVARVSSEIPVMPTGVFF